VSTGATTTTSTTTPLAAGRPGSTTAGLLVALLAAASFGFSGPFVKPLLESGWSPVAAVTVRALIGGVVLAPVALVALRGRLGPIWRARRRVLGMAVIGVAGTQVFYFAAVVRIPVGRRSSSSTSPRCCSSAWRGRPRGACRRPWCSWAP
jgi:hypothetical protein